MSETILSCLKERTSFRAKQKALNPMLFLTSSLLPKDSERSGLPISYVLTALSAFLYTIKYLWLLFFINLFFNFVLILNMRLLYYILSLMSRIKFIFLYFRIHRFLYQSLIVLQTVLFLPKEASL